MDARTAMAVDAYKRAAMAVRRAEKLDRELKAALAQVPDEQFHEYVTATLEIDARIEALPPL